MIERQIQMIVRRRKNRKKNDGKTKEDGKRNEMIKKNDGKKKE